MYKANNKGKKMCEEGGGYNTVMINNEYRIYRQNQ